MKRNSETIVQGRTDASLSRLLGYVWAMALTALVTLLAAPLHGHVDLANIVMLYVLAEVFVAFRFGRGAAAMAAVAGVAAFDFFFVPPRFSFVVADVQYLLTFAVMLITGLVVAHQAERLKLAAEAANLRERRSRQLSELARQLSGALVEEQIIEAAVAFFARGIGAKAALLLRDREGKLAPPQGIENVLTTEIDLILARTVFAADGADAGNAHRSGNVIYLPLRAPMRIRGVLLLATSDAAVFDDLAQRQQLETIAVLIAIALERVHFVTVAREATVAMEGERLRGVLLAALSHDLRTPLTAVLGSAESLQLSAAGLSEDQVALVQGIREQAQRTHALVENVLDMARLESGAVQLRRDWQSLEEIIGSALKARASMLAGHVVAIELPADLPLIECDATLIERVFVNLLENAAKYTPADSRITITAHIDGDHLRVDVIDSGSGVPSGQEAAIFDKFVRAHAAKIPGLGLGLAICRAIVEAHGGTIQVESASDGGADFVFTLPRGNPPLPAEDES